MCDCKCNCECNMLKQDQFSDLSDKTIAGAYRSSRKSKMMFRDELIRRRYKMQLKTGTEWCDISPSDGEVRFIKHIINEVIV